MTGQRLQTFEKIKILASEGLTREQISAQIGVCLGYVTSLAKDAGIDLKKDARAPNPRIAEMRELAAAGHTREEASTIVGMSYLMGARLARRNGIKFIHKGTITGPTERTRQMAALYTNGKTLEEIGQAYGITRERVRQLITRFHGLRRKDGGEHHRATQRKLKADASRNARSLKKWGCNFDQYQIIRNLKKPTRAFSQQKKNADARGVGWELNLWQWWSIWQQSGKWAERGRGQGYMMCRNGDSGPYAVDNVRIATGCENSFEGSRKKSGLPIGVRKNKRYAGYSAHRCVGGKNRCLGSYPTPELAHAAYLACGSAQ